MGARAGKQQALPSRANAGGGGGGVAGPKVNWIPGDNSGQHASAPRSQKYWDENGLNENKPDYAKTDSEVSQSHC